MQPKSAKVRELVVARFKKANVTTAGKRWLAGLLNQGRRNVKPLTLVMPRRKGGGLVARLNAGEAESLMLRGLAKPNRSPYGQHGLPKLAVIEGKEEEIKKALKAYGRRQFGVLK